MSKSTKDMAHNPSTYLIYQTDSRRIDLYGKTDAEISGILLLDELSISKNDASSNQESSIRIINWRNIDIKRLIIGNLNINSISNTGKFNQLKLLVEGKLAFLIIAESELDGSFPFNQFQIDKFYMSHRVERNRNGGEVLTYVCEDIPCK